MHRRETESRGSIVRDLLGFLFFLCVLVLHGPKVSVLLHGASARTEALEPLTLCGAAWVLAGTLPIGRFHLHGWDATHKLLTIGRYLFALPMVVFGIQHFMLPGVIASLIPTWIPGHLFWTYFTGTAFISAGVSIATKKYASLTATLLGAMFLLWVVCLHAPRVAIDSGNRGEWSSLFVALGISGGSSVVAGALSKEHLMRLREQHLES